MRMHGINTIDVVPGPQSQDIPAFPLSPKAEVSAPDSAKDFGRAKDEPMTGHQINSLVGDLVAMAQAMERLPQVEQERDTANKAAEDRWDTIQRLELKLMDAKNLEETLRSAIRDLEVARDDAELRFLELDEKVGKVVGMVDMAATYCKDAMLLITPSQPDPTPTISEVKPIAVDPTDVGKTEAVTLPDAVEQLEPVSGQSAVGPSDPLHTPAPADPTGTGTESVTSDTEPTKYLVGEGDWSYINPEWESWRYRQPPNSSS